MSDEDYRSLPEPNGDGAADHLPGSELPSVGLPATDDTTVRLDGHDGLTVVYCYPKTGRPDEEVVPDGRGSIPGRVAAPANRAGSANTTPS